MFVASFFQTYYDTQRLGQNSAVCFAGDVQDPLLTLSASKMACNAETKRRLS